jgi:serine/threonine-protein kinase
MWKSLEGADVGSEYRLKSLIGLDKEGAAFRAERLAVGRRAATVRLMVAGSCGQEARIRELAAAGYRHPNLVECFGAGLWQPSKEPFFYFAVESAGQQLSSLIQHWPLSVRQAREVTQGVASALCYLHGRPAPVVHQGVHPSNVMLVEGQWKLSDFGAAPAGGPLRTEGFGDALSYTPPEGIDGVVSPAWDIWSLGVLIVRAMTGVLPFQGDSEADLSHTISSQAPTVKVPLPAPFDVIVDGCLRKDPHSRWTAEQVLEAVGPPAASAGVSPSTENYRWAGWAVAVLAGLAAIVGGAFLIMRGPGEEPPELKGQAPEQAKFLAPSTGSSSPNAAPGNARQPKLIRRVEPDYPLAAREARISGTVRLHILVDKDGVVRDLKVVSGHPLLTSAAIGAVRQWLFQPLVAEGQPIAFETDVDIPFSPL